MRPPPVMMFTIGKTGAARAYCGFLFGVLRLNQAVPAPGAFKAPEPALFCYRMTPITPRRQHELILPNSPTLNLYSSTF
jgi:hypothetical protein